MIYTPMTKQAMKLCFAIHRDQTDRGGLPYVMHPLHLAEQMTDEASTIAALLHDTVEDTPYTVEDLRLMGFPEAAVNAIALLTHEDGVPYLDYVARLKNDPIARQVKLADLRHNSDLTRLDTIDGKALARAEKYKKAIELLEG